MKKVISLAVVLAMILSCLPAFTITAGAQTEAYVLFDASALDTSFHGDIPLTDCGWSGGEGANFSAQWGADGTWEGEPWGRAGLMFWRVGARQNGEAEDITAVIDDGAISAGASEITIEYTFAMQEEDNNYQTWYFKDLDGNVFATVYYDQGVKATFGPGGGGDDAKVYADGKDAVYALRGTTMKIEAFKTGTTWSVSYTSGGKLLGTDNVPYINGFGSITANLGQWNNQYAAMAMQNLKITVDIDTEEKADAIWASLQKQGYIRDGMKIRGNMALPTMNGITWESADAAINASTGAVTRPAYGEGVKPVRLTMVWNGNRKDYTVDVLPIDAGDCIIASADFDGNAVGLTVPADVRLEESISGCGNALVAGAGLKFNNSLLLDSFTLAFDSKTSTQRMLVMGGNTDIWLTDDGSEVTVSAPGGEVKAASTPLEWKKVVASYSDGELRLYINGQLVSANGDFGVSGMLSGLSSISFAGTGLIDNLTIYNRALTAEEINEYAAGYITPVMSVSGGSEKNPIDTFEPITITHPSGVGYIYYTLDGSEPTTASQKYTGPFHADGNAHVKARAIASNGVKTGTVEAWVYSRPWGATAAEFRIEGENTVNNVKIAWPLYAGATRYEVYRGDILVGSTIGDCVDDYNLEVNKNYTYTVKAYKDNEVIAEGTTNTVMTFAVNLDEMTGYDNNINAGGWVPNPDYVSEPKPSGYEINGKYYSTAFNRVSEEEWVSLGFDRELFKKACSVMSIRYKVSDDGFNWPDEWTFVYPLILDMRVEGPQTGLKYDKQTVSFSAHAEGDGFACSKLFLATFDPGKGTGEVEPYYVTAATGRLIPYAEQMEQSEIIENPASNQLSGYYIGRPFGQDSRDIVRFVDGENLYTFSATNNNNDMMIVKYQDNWVLPDRIENIILKGQHQESPSVFHDGNAYYIYTSTTNGWFQSQARYASAETLDGPWSPLREVANSGTFGTQANGVWGYGSPSGRVVQRGHGYNWGQSGGWRKNNYQIFFHLAINDGIATGNWCYRMEYHPYWGAIAVQSGELVSLGKKATVEGKDAPLITDNTQLQSSQVTEVEKLPYDIVIDLEKPTVISEVNLTTDIYMGSVCASYFKVYGSNDGSSWTQISDVTSDDYDDGAFRVGWVDDKTPYRYVKVNVIDVKNIQSGGGTALWGGKPLEVAVYGKPGSYVDGQYVPYVDEQYTPTDEILVGYDRKNVEFEGQKPVIVDGRTLVPLRAIFEAMGAEVNWDNNTQTVTATRNGTAISLAIGSDKLYVNGEERTLDVPAQLINGSTMVPVRAVAESFNCEVDWNDGARRVYIEESEE